MELASFYAVVLLIYFTQALQTRPSATNSTGPLTSEKQEPNSDLYVHRLAGRCSFTLTAPGSVSSDVVALTTGTAKALLQRICQDLECGSLHHVNQSSAPPNTTCLHRCDDANLQNCSWMERSDCTVINEAVCENQLVRLAAGLDRCTGRVELLKDGRWGTVCDDRWDVRDAHVVCGQLGCGYAIDVTGQGGSFPPGGGPVHLDEVNCTGREGNLWECPSQRQETDCGHKEDAGVICSEMKAVRLSGGLDRCSGRVEIHRNGSWGTVCDHCWNERLATVACSTLGCGTPATKFTQFDPPLAHSGGAKWYYTCPKGAHDLWQCLEVAESQNPVLCQRSKASGVICNGSIGFPNDTTATPHSTTPLTTSSTSESAPPPAQAEGLSSLLTVQLLSVVAAVCLLLLLLLITNTVLCCHYRKRHAFLVQQMCHVPQSLSENQPKRHRDSVSLTKVTSNARQAEAPSEPRRPWTQLSGVDNTYEPSTEASVRLSTFRNSQRYKTDSSTQSFSGLERLSEEAPRPRISGDVVTQPQYSRLSKISVDSFESSSTSSGESYENTNGYVVVTPGDEYEGHLYSMVSPDQDSDPDDEYDDVADVGSR